MGELFLAEGEKNRKKSIIEPVFLNWVKKKSSFLYLFRLDVKSLPPLYPQMILFECLSYDLCFVSLIKQNS